MNYSQEAIKYVKDFFKDVPNEVLSRRMYLEERDDSRERNQYQRDYARILYSSSFRRLQGKMQLLGVQSEQFYRNRLTHSLEVSQIARAIAHDLGYSEEELYIVESCSLAHDIGNPPFGHYGEKILNQISDDFGGFEGNAQTLRILLDLEKKSPNIPGLNLTLRTNLGIVKYFNTREKGKKKFIYKKNYDQINHFVSEYKINPRTIDVQIIDLADEIAYAAHDLEDALSLKLFTIDELLHEFYLYTKENKQLKVLQDIIDKASNVAKKGCTFNSSEEYSFLFRKELTSIIVNKLVNDIDLVDVTAEFIEKTGTRHKKELGFKSLDFLAKGLKEITFKCINRSNVIHIYEKRGEKILKGLYEVYINEKYNSNFNLLPVEYRPREGMDKRRLVIDYISGMMDLFSISMYEKFYGKGSLEQHFDKNIFM